jgi:hypothetical protein
MSYARNIAGQIYVIKIREKIVGTANIGDTFFSNLNITEPTNYAEALSNINQTSSRSWLLTDEVNPLHEKFAMEAKFVCLGPGVWLRESVILLDVWSDCGFDQSGDCLSSAENVLERALKKAYEDGARSIYQWIEYILARKDAERKKEENETRRQKARNFREAQENS